MDPFEQSVLQPWLGPLASLLTSPGRYVQLQAASAELVRGAFSGTAGLKERIEALESELVVWKLGHREAVKDREKAEREVRDYTVRLFGGEVRGGS